MNKKQRQAYLDKVERFHAAVTEALAKAERAGLKKPHDVGTCIMVALQEKGLDIRDTVKRND